MTQAKACGYRKIGMTEKNRNDPPYRLAGRQNKDKEYSLAKGSNKDYLKIYKQKMEG